MSFTVITRLAMTTIADALPLTSQHILATLELHFVFDYSFCSYCRFLVGSRQTDTPGLCDVLTC